MGQYSIKDLEVLSGIKAHTLRIWEQRYSLVEPHRTDTNIRYYSDSQLKLLLNVSLLNNSGYKISKIAELSPEEISLEVLNLDNEDLQEEKLITLLIDGMVSLDKKRIKSVLEESKNFKNIADYFVKVIFPFLSRVGMLWTSDSINPAQEHFASNIINRYLVEKIEDLPEPEDDAPLFLLFLPEGDWHVLSLLVSEYILKLSGKRVMYLGASVPDLDIEKILKLTPVHGMLCVSILSQPLESIQNTIDRFSEMAQDVKLIFGGRAFYHPKLRFPKSATILHSFEELATC